MPDNGVPPEFKEYEKGMTSYRVQGLTDGIFAVAMTLLILNIEAPAVRDQFTLTRNLFDLKLIFFDFVLSFLLLSAFWIAHHRQFHAIKKVDEGLLWINIVFLVFVVLVPFSTSLFGENRNLQIAAIFFELNLLIIGLTMYLQWAYVARNRHLVKQGIDDEVIKAGKYINLVIPGVSLIAIGASFISPNWSTTIYILVPFIVIRLRQKARSREE